MPLMMCPPLSCPSAQVRSKEQLEADQFSIHALLEELGMTEEERLLLQL
jgi:hypothetical protein